MTSQEKAELGSAAEAETHGQDAQKLSNIQDKVETEQVDNKSCGATLLSEFAAPDASKQAPLEVGSIARASTSEEIPKKEKQVAAAKTQEALTLQKDSAAIETAKLKASQQSIEAKAEQAKPKPKPKAAAKPATKPVAKATATAKASATTKPPAKPVAKKLPAAGNGGEPPRRPPAPIETLYLPEPKRGNTTIVMPSHDSTEISLSSIAIRIREDGWHGVYQGLWGKSLARRLIMATVVLPTIVIFLYLLFFASPAYISEAKFAVRGQSTATGLEGFSSLFNLSSTSQNDSYIVLSYIMSYDMFLKLDKALHLKEHYSDKKYDWWFRLWQNPTQDDIITFWEWACEVKYDPDTSILVVQVKAFEPDKALAICQEILKNSEELVNNMNIRSRKDAIAKAQQEVERSEERIRKARRDLQAYREKTVILDPGAVATGLYSVVNKLEDSVTQTAAELSEAMTYMNKDSPRVKQLENRLTVLQNQLAQEKKRLAGKVKGNESLSALLSEFQNLSLEEEFAQKQLTSAMTSLEAARVQADAQSQYIEAFERPVLADQSLYPRPALFALLYMVTSLLILGLVSLIVAAIREHAGG